MRKFWTSVLAAGFVATVGLSAQNAPPAGQSGQRGAQQPQTQTQAQSQSQSAKKVTVSGCIQSAPAGAQSSSKFVLAMKPVGGADKGGAVGTAGTSTRYALEGEEKEISPHLNHQVEITGMLEGPSAQASSSSAGAKAQASATPTLKVESLKMVSATCS